MRPTRTELGLRSLRGMTLFLLVMSALLFIPAGTLDYWQAWVLLTIYLVLSLSGTAYFLLVDPELIARRLTGGPIAEAEPTQKRIMTAMSVCILLMMIVPALDHRFGWSHVPTGVTITADLAVVTGFVTTFRVFAENTFASARVETTAGQTVIDTGPYAVVRHPMYAAMLLMFGAKPLALGSYWSFLLLVPFTAILAWRATDEERVLVRDLPGYVAYRLKVKYRLVPGVW